MLRWLAQLARLLSVPPDALHQRLADNAIKDPSPGLRLRNVRFLAEPSTQTPAPLLISLGRRLLDDVNPRVRPLLQHSPERQRPSLRGTPSRSSRTPRPWRLARCPQR
jgi:hypothetical protein